MNNAGLLYLKDNSFTFLIQCTTTQYGSIKYTYFSLDSVISEKRKNSLKINERINHPGSVFTLVSKSMDSETFCSFREAN